MSHTLTHKKSIFENLSNIKENLVDRYTRYKKYKSTIKELNRLSDYELRDIGINRGMIRAIAMEVYYDG